MIGNLKEMKERQIVCATVFGVFLIEYIVDY